MRDEELDQHTVKGLTVEGVILNLLRRGQRQDVTTLTALHDLKTALGARVTTLYYLLQSWRQLFQRAVIEDTDIRYLTTRFGFDRIPAHFQDFRPGLRTELLQYFIDLSLVK